MGKKKGKIIKRNMYPKVSKKERIRQEQQQAIYDAEFKDGLKYLIYFVVFIVIIYLLFKYII